MAMFVDIANGLVHKTIIYPGKGDVSEFPKDTKVTFHFRTEKQEDENAIIDDSKAMGKPMELIIGKKFKLEVWELCVKTMRLSEVSRFAVDKSLLTAYPWVSKTLRKALGSSIDKGQGENAHCCGFMSMQREGMGAEELDELMKNPQSLNFVIELLSVELPGEYSREVWAMDDNEKLSSVPGLREEGNELYRQEQYTEAAAKYAEALGMLEHLVLREKPEDDEWNKLETMKIPLLLNFSQCKLLLGDYYSVITHTTTVLEKDPNNIKALFRRAKAHVGAWNPQEAYQDFMHVKELDPKSDAMVTKELQHLEKLQRSKDSEDAACLRGKMFKS